MILLLIFLLISTYRRTRNTMMYVNTFYISFAERPLLKIESRFWKINILKLTRIFWKNNTVTVVRTSQNSIRIYENRKKTIYNYNL